MSRGFGALTLAALLMSTQLLSAHFAWSEEARVLPQGRSRMILVYGQSGGISRTYNDAGRAESITAPYNLELSSANLKQLSPDLQRLINELNNTQLHFDPTHASSDDLGATYDDRFPRLGDALSRGFLEIEAVGTRKQFGISYQYGISDRLSLALFGSVIKNRVEVSHSIQGTSNVAAIRRIADAYYPGQLDQITQGLALIEDANFETLQAGLAAKGYDRFETWEGSGLSDLIAGTRYNYFQAKLGGAGELYNSLQTQVTIPTGRLKPASALAQVDFGQGAFDFSAAHLTNYFIVPEFKLSHGLHLTQALSSSRTLRIRKDATDTLPDASAEENVSMLLGRKVWTTAGFEWNLNRDLILILDYEWAWKFKDRYEGARADRDYGYLSDKTDRYTENLQLGLMGTSIPAFLAKEFSLPAQLTLTFNLPVRGRNALITPYGVAELALFF